MDRASRWLDIPERFGLVQRLLPYALLVSVTFALYSSALFFDFVWDDGPYVQSNSRIQGLSLDHLRTIWLSPYLGHYAPLHNTLLAILHAFSGLNPFGYHAGQMLLHAACLCLLFRVLEQIESARVALLVSLLLAVHPTTIETAVWIAESKSTLAFFFFLLSFWFFVRFRREEHRKDGILCGIFLCLSWLSKINTVVAPVIFVLYEWKEKGEFKKTRLRYLVSYFLISIIMIAIHLANFYAPGGVPEVTYYPGGLLVHLLNLPTLILFYLRMIFYPHPLSGWHLIAIKGTLDWVLGVKWVLMLAFLWLFSRGSRNSQFWVLWFLVFLLPVLQIVPFPIWVAERYLYIPAIGIFVLGAQGFFWVMDRLSSRGLKVVWESGMALILITFAGLSWAHLPVWENDLTFWQATEKTCPTAAYCHVSLGRSLLRARQTEQGIKELIRAVEIRPTFSSLMRLGDAYVIAAGDFRQGFIAYQMAREQASGPLPAEYYARLGRAHLLAGDVTEAMHAVQSGFQTYGNDPSLLIVNGFLQWKLGNKEAARQSLRSAFSDPELNSATREFVSEYWGDRRELGELFSGLDSSQRPNRHQK